MRLTEYRGELSPVRQESKRWTSLFTYVRNFTQYAIGFEKPVSGLLWQEATKQGLLIKTTPAVVYMYNSAYSSHNTVKRTIFISIGEAQMGAKAPWKRVQYQTANK